MIGVLESIGIGIGATFLMSVYIDSKKDYKKDSEIKTHRELRNLKGKGFIISENVRLSEKYSNEQILVIAPPGAGKSRNVIMPNVNKLSDEECTLIISDPKGEIQKSCKTGNKKPYVLAPFKSSTIGYDPLKNCRSTTEVRKIAKLILVNGSLAISQMTGSKSDNADWIQRATTLLTAYMLWNYRSKKYPFHILVKRLVSESLKTIGEEIMNSNVSDAKTTFMSFMQVAQAPQTLACIRDTLFNNLELFLDDSVKKVMSKPSIDFSKLRKEESIVYIQVPERHAAYYSPLTSVFITQLLDRLLEDENGLQTYLLLDEMTNIGKLPLVETLSTCRSRRIGVLGCIQSLNQLEMVYGDQIKVLPDLFKTMVFMSGLKDSAEYASNLTGVKKEEGYMDKLLTSDMVRRLNSRELLIVAHNKQPVIDRLYR